MLLNQSLIDVLRLKIAQIKELPRTVQKEVEEIMLEKFNVSYGTTIDIFNGLLPLETLDNNILYKLMVSISEMVISNDRYEQLDINDLYPQKYFTEFQIKEYKKPLKVNVEDEDIVIDNWLQVASDQYVCVVPIEQIIKWRNMNKIKYNPETQRDLVEKVTKGGIVIKVIKIFDDALNAIKKLMRENLFIPDDITFNVNPDYYDEIPTIKNGKLVITTPVDIIDGFHRYRSMYEIKDANPDWQFNCIINIMTFTKDKAIRYMLQKDKKNHLSTEQIIRSDIHNLNNYVITRLSDSGTFHHRGKINDNIKAFLIKLISEYFNPKEKPEAVQLSKLIENISNRIIEDNDLYDTVFSKHEWFIYLYLLKKCNCNSDLFFNILKDVNINELLNEIKFINRPTKKHYKIIDTIFNEVKNNE